MRRSRTLNPLQYYTGLRTSSHIWASQHMTMTFNGHLNPENLVSALPLLRPLCLPWKTLLFKDRIIGGGGWQQNAFFVATVGRPLCIHSATTKMPLCPFCLIWATVERPTSSATIWMRLFWRRWWRPWYQVPSSIGHGLWVNNKQPNHNKIMCIFHRISACFDKDWICLSVSKLKR